MTSALHELERSDTFTCEEHGEWFKARQSAAKELQEFVEADFSEEEMIEYATDNPAFSYELQAFLAQQDYLQAIGEPVYFSKIQALLTKNKTSRINDMAKDMAKLFVEKLGRQPDSLDTMGAMTSSMLVIIAAQRSAFREVKDEMSSRLINQVGNYMLVYADQSKLCGHFNVEDKKTETAYRKETAPQIVRAFRILHPNLGSISTDFIASKIEMHHNNIDILRQLKTIIPSMPETGMSKEEDGTLKEHNTEFTKDILRIRRYGIKPVAFDSDDIAPKTELVYDEFSNMQYAVMGEQPIAAVKMVNADAEPERKFGYSLIDRGKETGTNALMIGDAFFNAVLDSNGEIYSGLHPSDNSVPLRDYFEQLGYGSQYEVLRTRILEHLFDSIAPATVVNRIVDQDEFKEPVVEKKTKKEASDIVRPMVLPRRKYFQTIRIGQIRKEFNLAVHNETIKREEAHRFTRLHGVAAHLREIPKGSKASAEAVARSKLARGEDYEIPEGYTFVKSHERGDETRGKVLGYKAVQHTVKV